MPKKKDAKALNIKIATDVSDRLESFCEESGMTKTVAVEKILTLYFDKYFQRPAEERLLFK